MKPLYRFLTMLLLSAIAGCGGNTQVADGGIGGTGITMGRVSGFGSVYVNGIEFDTAGSEFIIEEASGFDEGAIQLGMVVRISGDYQGATGTAFSIEYRNELMGVVTASSLDTDGNGILNVLGQRVHVNATTIFDSGVHAGILISQLATNDLIEVSGFRDGMGEIYATRIELKSRNWTAGSDTLEVKGLVTNLSPTEFNIGGLLIDYSAVATLPAGDLTGLYVEVRGTQYDPLTQILQANAVDLVDGGLLQVAQDSENVELEGVVTSAFDSITGEFQLNGQAVRLGDSTQLNGGDSLDIQVGRELSADGVMNGTVLEADEISFDADESQLQEMAGLVEEPPDLSTGSLKMLGQTVLLNSSTIMQDEESQVRYFDLSDIRTGDYIEVDVYFDGPDLVAAKLEREQGTRAEVEGFVQAVNVGGDPERISILDITIDISTTTFTPSVGQRIEVEGNYANGLLTATSVEIDF